MSNDIFKRKKRTCSNCGKYGHEYKSCTEPISSFGIICIHIDDVNGWSTSRFFREMYSTINDKSYKIFSSKYPNIQCTISDNKSTLNEHPQHKIASISIPIETNEQIHKILFYRNHIKFLMVSRKYSIGFVEFVRGNYDVTEPYTIIKLFNNMYEEDIKHISHGNYDDLIIYFMAREMDSSEKILEKIYDGKYSSEYLEAKVKFNALKNPQLCGEEHGIPFNLKYYTDNIKPKWDSYEWGFPKGRRDRDEDNYKCACREFEEETGTQSINYSVLNKIDPVEEIFLGTNGVTYKHQYYIGVNNADNCNLIDYNNYDKYEIGEIKWLTYDEAINIIRPHHTERRKILTQIYMFVMEQLIKHI